MSDCWSTVILEAYCMFDYISKKQHTFYPMTKDFKFDKKNAKTEKNKDYVPKTSRPKWCQKRNREKIPRYECLGGYEREPGKCPFFCFCEGDIGDLSESIKKSKNYKNGKEIGARQLRTANPAKRR